MTRSGVPAWFQRHRGCLAIVVAIKLLRVKVGALLVLFALARTFILGHSPLDMDTPSVWVTIGLLLITTGALIRLAAHGVLSKDQTLARSGVYSLCRHPLYLGSILIACGFCTILNDATMFAVALAYFALFYGVTIAWEEIMLAARFGAAHEDYRTRVPLLLPIGGMFRNGFSWAQAFRGGGAALVTTIIVLLVTVEAIAEYFEGVLDPRRIIAYFCS